MIRVLHLIDTYRVGGPGKTILNSAAFIDRARFAIHVAAFVPDSGSEFVAAARDRAIPVLELREQRRIDKAHVFRLRRYVAEQGIQVVHAHGYRSDVIAYCSRLWAAARPALVTTHHGWIRNSWRQRVMSRMAIGLSTRFDGIEVVAQSLLSELPRGSLARAAVVYNGIVMEDYQARGDRHRVRRLLGLGDSDRALLAVGRLSVEKGWLELVEAFKELASPALRVHLIVVGEGPMRDALGDMVRSHGVSGRVHFVGYQENVQPYYEAADVFVCPSRTEGLSNVLLEAMTNSLPVVATRVGGNPEIVEDGRSGLLVSPMAPSELTIALTRILTQQALASALGQQARERVAHRFSFFRRMRDEEAFYDRVLARARPEWSACYASAANHDAP